MRDGFLPPEIPDGGQSEGYPQVPVHHLAALTLNPHPAQGAPGGLDDRGGGGPVAKQGKQKDPRHGAFHCEAFCWNKSV